MEVEGDVPVGFVLEGDAVEYFCATFVADLGVAFALDDKGRDGKGGESLPYLSHKGLHLNEAGDGAFQIVDMGVVGVVGDELFGEEP